MKIYGRWVVDISYFSQNLCITRVLYSMRTKLAPFSLKYIINIILSLNFLIKISDLSFGPFYYDNMSENHGLESPNYRGLASSSHYPEENYDLNSMSSPAHRDRG